MRKAIVAVLFVVAGTVLPADSLEETARALEGKLMAPCCMGNPVADHHSAVAERMRREIRAMLAQGKSEDEILDHYVARHGEQILALPRPSGFNLTAYFLPGLLLTVTAVLLWISLRRWQTRQTPESSGEETPPIDSAWEERLRQELKRF